ncbi:MAG: ComEC/Rec2 family competence protein [Opitutaceae bacterium]|nr:ComEC/Rec2 family competence protein [Opitutaceae bacterium]
MAIRDEGYRAPVLWLLIPFGAGTLIQAPTLREHSTIWIAACALAAAGAIFAAGRVPGRAGLLLWSVFTVVAAMILGGLRVAPSLELPERWRALPPREVTLEVELIRVFPANAQKPVASALARITTAGPLVSDLAGARVHLSQVALPDGAEPLRSQSLRVSGVIESVYLDATTLGLTKPRMSSASFRDYLLSNAVFFRLTRCRVDAMVDAGTPWQRWNAALGERFSEILRTGLPKRNDAAGAYLAMFLGRKDAMSDEQQLHYLQTGAMHLFAISGLHIAVIAGCMHALLRLLRMPPLVRAIVGILALTAFVEATGGTPSARRALVMVGLVWLGASLRRPANPIASIATAAFAVLLIDPLALRNLSFQFSYSVVAMLLLYAAPLTNRWLARWHPWAHLPDNEWRWWHRRIFFSGRGIIIISCTSWSAALISTPLTVAYFGIATPGAVIANLVLVPVSLYSIVSGFASILCGLCGLSWLSVVFNNAGAMILALMNSFASAAASLPGMHFAGRFSEPWIAPALVAATLALCLAGYGRRWARVPGGFLLPPALLIPTLVLLVTRPAPPENSAGMKSAYELAMERLQRAEPGAEKPLTPEQKERLAEIHRVYQGKIAEREIFLQQRLAEVQARGELEEAGKIRVQLASERTRLEEERDAEKERVRRA